MKNVVIAGGGDVGYLLAKILSEEGHNLTVIDSDPEVARKLESLDVLVILGNAASPRTLNKAYINSADIFISVTSSDEVNMAACSIAKSRGCRTLARINNDDYITQPVSTEDLKDTGIDIAFCPELISSMHMANILSIPVLLDSPLFGQGMVRVVEARVDRESKVVGKEIRKLGFPREVNLVAVYRNEEVLIPSGSLKLDSNDRVVAIMPFSGNEKTSKRLSDILGKPRLQEDLDRIGKVIIAGGSRIGYHLSKLLEERDMSIILIEEDPEICRELSERLPGVLVIQGLSTDRELLTEEGVSEADAFLAVTRKEEVNILTSLMARQYGAKRSIALVDRPGLKSILEEVGVDLVISPRSATLSTILKYFHQEDFESLAILNQGEAQVVELKIKARSRAVKKRIDKLSILRKRNILIGAIVRGNGVIIPRGDTVIRAGDRIVAFTRSASLKALKDYF